MKSPRLIAGLAVCLAGVLFLLAQRLGFGPGGGGGAGAGRMAVPGDGDATPSSSQPAASGRQPETPSKPLQITIDDTKYFVGDLPVESVDELVKMAVAVPKDVPPPRVLVLSRPTARYLTQKKLIDALQAAKIDYMAK